jgi:hypothetical protein
MAVPNIFGTATSAIPLSQLDQNFATAITLGNTAVYLGNTTTSLGNVTLTNVTISSGNVTLTGANVSGTANVSTLVVTGNQSFVGTGNRITGDFSNGTVANRVAFQSSTANSATSVHIIPSGTGTTGQIELNNASDATNSSTLQLASTSTAASLSSGTRGTGTYLPMTFATGGAEAMRITNAGSAALFGLGASSPLSKLQVAATQTSYSNDLAQLIISGTDTNQRLLLGYNTSTDQAFIQATKVGTAYQNLFVQPNGGSFTVGTTDTTLFNNTSGNGVCYRVNSSFDVATSGDNCVILNRMTSTGQIQEFRYAGSAVGNISTNGSTVTFSGTALSDSRWKENVTSIENALSSVMEVNFVSFDYKESGNSSAGVTAQQLQSISSFSKYVNNGLSDEDYKTVDYNALIGFLGKAIQEQQALIQSLTTRITALEAK